MPNTAQKEVLNEFIASDGIYFETIKEYDENKVDLGTKILYLERAISQDCQTFLKLVDKLYQPGLGSEDERKAHLEFIRSLKTINDLCFNNEVKYSVYGLKSALTHYFGALGDVNANDFQILIKEIINENLTTWCEGQEKDVATQKQAREIAKNSIISQSGWRFKLDLPQDQLDLPQDQLPSQQNTFLSASFIQSISSAFANLDTEMFSSSPSSPNALSSGFFQTVIPPHITSNQTQETYDMTALIVAIDVDLEEQAIQPLIDHGYITVEQVEQLTFLQRLNLESAPIRELITNGQLLLDDALALTSIQRYAIEHGNAQTVLNQLQHHHSGFHL